MKINLPWSWKDDGGQIAGSHSQQHCICRRLHACPGKQYLYLFLYLYFILIDRMKTRVECENDALGNWRWWLTCWGPWWWGCWRWGWGWRRGAWASRRWGQRGRGGRAWPRHSSRSMCSSAGSCKESESEMKSESKKTLLKLIGIETRFKWCLSAGVHVNRQLEWKWK